MTSLKIKICLTCNIWPVKTKGQCKRCYYKEWYLQNGHKQRERMKKHYQENRDVILEKRSNYKKTLAGKLCNRNYTRRRRAWKRDGGTDITSDFLIELWNSTSICAICEKELGSERHLDHILPLCLGGLHRKENVRFVHPHCNMQRPRKVFDSTMFSIIPRQSLLLHYT